MKHPHTRAAIKQSCKSFKTWANDTFVGIPKAFRTDVRINRDAVRRAKELLAQENSATETPETAQ